VKSKPSLFSWSGRRRVPHEEMNVQGKVLGFLLFGKSGRVDCPRP